MTAESDVSWSYRRLLVMLMGIGLFVTGVVAGLALAVVDVLRSGSSDETRAEAVRSWSTRSDGTKGTGYRNQVAAAPMLEANADDMQPAEPAATQTERSVIAAPTRTGPEGVPTGFPHTPDGAIGQLAAVEVAALTPMSIDRARHVYDRWAIEPAQFTDWEISESIRSFHRAAGTVDGDGSVSLVATPVGAQVKGSDGPDWVLACVQLDVTVTVEQQTRFGFGHCSRMAWRHGRWMIDTGAQPAQAPSTWPGSQRSIDAGWSDWVEDGDPE